METSCFREGPRDQGSPHKDSPKRLRYSDNHGSPKHRLSLRYLKCDLCLLITVPLCVNTVHLTCGLLWGDVSPEGGVYYILLFLTLFL